MPWKDRLLGFVRTYGSAAKIVATSVVNVAVPGGGALVNLLEQAFDSAKETAQGDWEAKLLEATQRNAAELDRLGELVDVLANDLAKVCDKARAFADQPDEVEDVVRRAISGDRSLAQPLRKLNDLSDQFVCLQEQNRRLLDGQDEMLPILRRLNRMVDFFEECWAANLKARDISELAHSQQNAVEQLHHQSADLDTVLLDLEPLLVDRTQPRLGTTITNSLGMKFAWVPSGTSWLGGSGGRVGTKPFTLECGCYCGIYPVTQGEWQAVMGNNPSHFSRRGEGREFVRDIADPELKRFPVESVSLQDVQAFLAKLNGKDNLVYRLPSELEWEYICRGGSITQVQSAYDFYFGTSMIDGEVQPTNDLSSRQANFDGNHPAGFAPRGPYLERPCAVGLYLPNPLGVYDLHGNVWELTSSVHGTMPIYRGGSWLGHGVICAAASRCLAPEYGPTLGFRLLGVPS